MIAFSTVWSAVTLLWEKFPWWIKFPLAVLIGPNLIVNTVLFYFFVIPFVQTTASGLVKASDDKRDIQIEQVIELQKVHNEAVLKRMDDFDKHQMLIYQTLIKR